MTTGMGSDDAVRACGWTGDSFLMMKAQPGREHKEAMSNTVPRIRRIFRGIVYGFYCSWRGSNAGKGLFKLTDEADCLPIAALVRAGPTAIGL